MSTTPFDPLASPCLWCDYRGEGYWQRGTHARGCPWFHLGGEEARREALRVVIAGTVAESEGLATEREKRLGAELAAEQLREVIQEAASDRSCCVDTVEMLEAALSAPPPSLDPLRELVRAVGALLAELESAPWHCGAEADVAGKHSAALALYPFLREAEGEVERG